MAALRLVAFCAFLSTALSFVALAPLSSSSAVMAGAKQQPAMARVLSARAGANRARTTVGMAPAGRSMSMQERT